MGMEGKTRFFRPTYRRARPARTRESTPAVVRKHEGRHVRAKQTNHVGLNDGREGRRHGSASAAPRSVWGKSKANEGAGGAGRTAGEGGVAGEGSARALTTRRRAAEPASVFSGKSADRAAPTA